MLNPFDLRGAFRARARITTIVDAARAEIRMKNNDTRLTAEAKLEDVARIKGDAAADVSAQVDTIAATAERLHRSLQAKLDTLRGVDDQALATRAAILSPLLQAAATRPQALIAAYRKHHGDPVSRRLIEQTADTVTLVLEGADAKQFEVDWMAVQAEVRPDLPQAERDLLDQQAGLANLDQYVAFVSHWANGLTQGITDATYFGVWSGKDKSLRDFERRHGFDIDGSDPTDPLTPVGAFVATMRGSA